MLYKYRKRFPSASVLILNERIEFSVRECTGSAFSKRNIGFRIQTSSVPERLNIPAPLLHRLSPFQKYRTISVNGKQITAEKSGRSGADNDGTMFQLTFSRLREYIPFPGHNRYVSAFTALDAFLL